MRNTTHEQEEASAEGGVTAVTRALSLMEAFEVGESTLSLAELSRRSGMHKTTALRLARTHTSREDVIVLEAAYHGHTTTLVDVSPYKFNGPGGRGAKRWVHVAPIPDDYRGPYKREDPQAGLKYARQVEEIIESVHQDGGAIAAFLAETLPSVGGQIVLPPGYLNAVYRAVRAAGGVTIHHRLGTVVAGAHRDALLVEDGAEVVGVHSLHDEGHQRGLVSRGAEDADVRLRAHGPRRFGEERRLVRRDRFAVV